MSAIVDQVSQGLNGVSKAVTDGNAQEARTILSSMLLEPVVVALANDRKWSVPEIVRWTVAINGMRERTFFEPLPVAIFSIMITSLQNWLHEPIA